MSLTRWQPFRERLGLPSAIDSFFDDSFFRGGWGENGSTLPLDIIERDNELLVRAAAPGFEPEDFDISVQGDMLTLRGTAREEHEEERENYHLREYRTQSFHRTVRLPHHVESNDVQAEYKNGILTIHLPKSREQVVKRIPVRQG